MKTTGSGLRTDSASARRIGMIAWAMYDWANSAFAAVVSTFVFAAYFTRQVAPDETIGTNLWGNTIGIASLAVAVLGPVLGAMADQGGSRKPWVAWFTVLCICATALLWYVEPSVESLWPAMALVAVATLGSEFANIFYNSMLPSLATPERVGRWSGWGWGLGYAGGLACLLLALFGLVTDSDPWIDLPRENAEHVRATFLLVSVWYLMFALPLFLLTPDTPRSGKRWSQAAREGLAQLGDSLRQVRAYGPLIRFLVARMFFIDGLATVFAFGGVYAAGTFAMDEQAVLMFGIGLNVTAGLGALSFAWVDDWLGGKRTIVVSLVGLMIFGTLVLVVQSALWFWVFGLALGVFVGPVQAASRSYMARVAPPHLYGQMFGLLAFSGKATAFVGPLLVGWVTWWAQSQRVGMATVVVFFAAGFVLMVLAPSDRSGSERGQ